MPGAAKAKSKKSRTLLQTAKPAPSWLRPAIFGLSALLLLAWLSREAGDSDTWWHLRTGQFILSQHRLPVPDPFAWTTYLGKPLYPGEEITRYFILTHEWLAQVAMYGAYAAGGVTALVLMRAIALTLFCALAGLMAWRRTHAFYRALAAAFAVAIVAHSFTADRPQYITYVSLALTINLLDARRWLWALPPIFLIWSNCHAGFFLGWVAIAIYSAEAPYRKWRVLLPELTAILVSGLNPNGFRVFEVLRYYRESPLQQQILEWHAPKFWELSPFTVLLYGGLLALFLNRRKARPADWLLLIVFGAAGLLAFRNIVFTAFVGAYVIAARFPAWKERRPAAEFALAAAILAAIAVLIAQGQAFQFHVSARTPVAAADFLDRHDVHGRLFNTYGQGGYLIWRLWPRLRVFIDGRVLNESVSRDAERILFAADDTAGKSGEDLLKEYGIDIIVMDCFEPISGAAYYLPAALADPQQTEWKLVYRDGHDVIYMRNPPPDVQPLNALESLDAMEDQCSFLIEDGAPNCARGMIDVFTRIGDNNRAQKWEAIRRAARH